MASTPANNYDPVIIVDEKTANQVVYTWPRILRKDLKEAFGFTGYFTVITGERYLVKPDGETYELEHGTTYYIDGERQSPAAHPESLIVYSETSLQGAENEVRNYFPTLRMNFLGDLTTVGYRVVQLQITADNDKIRDISLDGPQLKQLQNRKLKGALEEIAQELKRCFELERSGTIKIKDHASLTIRFLKEWSQAPNAEKLHVDCEQLMKIIEGCYKESNAMTLAIETVVTKISELLQSLPGVNEYANTIKCDIVGHKKTKQEECEAISARSLRLKKQQNKENAVYRELCKETEDLDKWIHNSLHLFINKLYDLIIGSLSGKDYVPCKEKDQINLDAAHTRENAQREKANRKKTEYLDMVKCVEDIDNYIERLSSKILDIDQLIEILRNLRETMRTMSYAWARYKEYFSHFLSLVKSMSQQLHSFVTYNKNGKISHTAAAPRVLEIVGYCATLITSADIYEEVSERFVRPVMFYYESGENRGIEFQKNLKLLADKNKTDAEQYLQRQNTQAPEKAIEQLRDFAAP